MALTEPGKDDDDGFPFEDRPYIRSSEALSQDQIEEILTASSAWRNGSQIRALSRADLDELMVANATVRKELKPTAESLCLAGFKFEERVDVRNLNFEYADLHSCQLMYAHFQGSSLLHVNLSGALLCHANFENAWLHDAEMQRVLAYNARYCNAMLFRSNFTSADLRSCNFSGARLEDANLANATTWRADFTNALLNHSTLTNTDCWDASFQDANLSGAILRGTNLKDCDLKRTSFGGVIKENDFYVLANIEAVSFEGAKWSPHYILPEEASGKHRAAIGIYRTLKEAHQRAGLYEVADRFAYREQVALRKNAFTQKDWISAISKFVAELLFGYGYRWRRVVLSSIIMFLIFAIVYWIGGLFGGRGLPELGKSLYFSAVSFSAIGYGPWIADSPSHLKYLGAIEAPLGVFMMALFLVTFTRKYLR